MGIRPEDIKDEEIFINAGSSNVLDATVRVYEMLGAEVFLYFSVEDTTSQFVLILVQQLVLVIRSRSLLIPARSISSIRIQRQQSQTSLIYDRHPECICIHGIVDPTDLNNDLNFRGCRKDSPLYFVQNDDKIYAVLYTH